LRLLILSAALLFVAQAQSPVKRKALVIANAKYKILNEVQTAEADASHVESALKELGFVITKAQNLTYTQLRAFARTFTSSVQPGDEVFVYFCGIGMNFDSDNYILSVDFDPASKGSAYSLTRLAQDLDDQKAANKTIFIDAARPGRNFGEAAGLLMPSEQIPETVMVFSHQFQQVFNDDPAARPSVFAKAVAEALRKPGLTISAIAEQVIVETANQTKNRQQPVTAMQRLSKVARYRAPEVVERIVERKGDPVVIVKQAELEPGATRELKKASMVYSWIPAGEFQMGCVPGDKDCTPAESPRHAVKITKPFWITKTEVTAKSYQDFARATGAAMPKPTTTNKDWLLRANPVTKVSWESAQQYCNWIGGRLPTEAEWEYAARAGKAADTIFPWGNTADFDNANMFGKPKDKTKRDQWDEFTSAPIGSFDGNAWGLMDVSGNVREWVQDWFDPAYYQSPSATGPDPTGPASSPAQSRVLRGGDFYSKVEVLRLSARENRKPDEIDNRSGFRCVLPTWPQ
jgi:formylglycine-generating enzyme required for sulfatase activity